MQITENLRSETVLLPPPPLKSELDPVSFVAVVSGAQIIASVAKYDDPRTKRPVDYMELYDGSGDLLVVSWFDQFGISRTAMDRGLLQEGAMTPEGVLVLLPEGTLL